MPDLMYHMDQQGAFFPVSERPVFAGEYSKDQLAVLDEASRQNKTLTLMPDQFHAVPNRKALTNDQGETMAIVSQNYKVVTTEQIFESFSKALDKSDIDCEGMTTKTRMANNGARTLVHLTFPAHKIELRDRSRSAILEIIVRNSYDRHWKFDVRGGLIDCICFNECFTGNWAAAYSCAHNANLDIDVASSKVVTILDDFKDTPELWMQMKESKIQPETAWRAIAMYANQDFEMQKNYYKYGHPDLLQDKGRHRKTVSRNMMDHYLSQEVPALGSNAFALMNCLTYDATHRKIRTGQEANAINNRMHRVAKVMESSFWHTTVCPLA